MEARRSSWLCCSLFEQKPRLLSGKLLCAEMASDDGGIAEKSVT